MTPNRTESSQDPFVDKLNENFKLKTGLPAGNSSLDSKFNKDMYGNTRGADGNWDRGAIEFISNTPLPLSAPSNLEVK